jgi:hypothetical protein
MLLKRKREKEQSNKREQHVKNRQKKAEKQAHADAMNPYLREETSIRKNKGQNKFSRK